MTTNIDISSDTNTIIKKENFDEISKKLLVHKKSLFEICCGTKCECSCACIKKIPCKRYFLILSLSLGVIWFDELRHYVYMPLIVGFNFFILFWNFPILVYYTASRPLYYEDLFIDTTKLPNYEVDFKIKSKFKSILTWVLIIMNTLLSGALSDYWLYRFGDKNYTILELLGITGGIVKLFQIVNNTIARIMLKLLRCFILNENRENEQIQNMEVFKIINLKLKETTLSS